MWAVVYGKVRLLNLGEMIEAAGQCQKSERRSLHERGKQIEIEDAELKVSGSEMMSRGFKERERKRNETDVRKLKHLPMPFLGFHIKCCLFTAGEMQK